MPPFRPSLPTILVVDDRPENLLALGELLADVDCDVTSTESGEEAIELAKDTEFALILLDVQMPGIGGIETADKIRRLDSSKRVPIIFVTAAREDEIPKFQGYEAGAVDFLYKPIDSTLLLGKVKIFLDVYRYQRELERSNGALRDFAHAASHDLRAPVRHIHSYSRFLLEDYGDVLPEDGREMLMRIQESTVRMRDLIDSILEHAAVGAAHPKLGHVDLDEVVTNVISDLQTITGEAQAVIEVERLPIVVGESVLLGRLFQNLLSNALKYRKPGVTPEIVISCETIEGADTCLISVKDNGIGFSQVDEEKIFLPFRRLVSSEQYPGSGIGMTTVMKIVEIHGGSISGRGVLGQGATFVVALPMPSSELISQAG